MDEAGGLADRLRSVGERIGRASARSGRAPGSVRLLAITKGFPAATVREAVALGLREFGENRIQEAEGKIGELDPSIRWHLVGHLQSNKAKKAGQRFDVVHSVDDAALVSRLDEAAADAARTVQLLVQVDLAGEVTKHGAREDDLVSIFDAARRCRSARVVGLMLLPPAVDDPEQARAHFRALREVRERLLARGIEGSMLGELSMGMSHDFEVAIEEGATLVRVGTAIFGYRGHV